MSKRNESLHEASAPALGYLYQVRYSLLLALKKLEDVSDPDDSYISIETLDDIVFGAEGSPIDIIQTKHSSKPGNLTDRSSDLWKTLRIWSKLIADATVDQEFVFSLVTTQSITRTGVLSRLGLDLSLRDPGGAIEILSSISKETTSETNATSYVEFSQLSEWQKAKLVNSIFVVCDSPQIQDVKEILKRKLRLTVSAQHIDAFNTRLEGLWFQRSIDILSADNDDFISLGELQNIMDDLRYQFLPTNLPDDYNDSEPEGIYADHESFMFVEQLKLVGAPDSVLKLAILNYYRAFEQRSRWSREGLVKPGELSNYLNQLEGEWQHINSIVEWKEHNPIDLYEKCQSVGAIPIRPEFKSNYVARGSYHSLSNDLRIGWHPNYENLLSKNDEQETG